MVANPKKRIPKKKKIALVLSGGGTKAAAFHIGVSYALKDAGFEFYQGLRTDQGQALPGERAIQTYVGSSGGSFIATLLAAGYSLENISASFIGSGEDANVQYYPRKLPKLQYMKMFKIRPELAKEQANQFQTIKNVMSALIDGRFPSLLQLKWLRMTGFFSTQGLEQFIREEVLPSNRFEDFKPELFIVGTQLNEARKVVFGKKEYPAPPHDPNVIYMKNIHISDAIAASASLPVVFAPYPLIHESGDKYYYIDGETRETLSTHIAVDSGADLVIQSYTHQPYHWVREVGSLTKLGLPAIVIQGIYTLLEQKINSMYESYLSKKNAMAAVEKFCRESDIHPALTEQIIELLEKELHQKRDIDLIPIHPDPTDTKTFLAEHLTLNPNKLGEIVKAGYKAGKRKLAEFDFE